VQRRLVLQSDMPAEVLNFRLTQRSKPVGTHVLRTELQGSTALLEGRLQLQGPLGRLSITQTSKTHSQRHFSLTFREEQQKRGANRNYEVQFDRRSGLMTAKATGGGTARLPYFRQYRDPLGMLLQLRALAGSGEEPEPIPMVGHDVAVLPLGDVELETALGMKAARVYRLHPGGSTVWIDSEAPHAILKMTQRIDGAPIEVTLTGIIREESSQPPRRRRVGAAPKGEAQQQGEGKQGEARSRSRSPRRRRRRRN